MIEELLAAHGKRLPGIPDTAGRRAYLSYLSWSGYSEEELLPVIEREKVTPEALGATMAGLITAIESGNSELLEAVSWIAVNAVSNRYNTNMILHSVAQRLMEDIESEGVAVPEFYAGVYPTDIYGSESQIWRGERLVLINTAFMEMCETAVASFLSSKSHERKAEDLAQAASKYAISRVRPDSTKLDLPGVNWGCGEVSNLLNWVEGFVVAHELGHHVLGHVTAVAENGQAQGGNCSLEELRFREFQADVWACKALVPAALTRALNRLELSLLLSAPIFALGMDAVVQAAKRGGRAVDGDHPPSMERIALIQALYHDLGVGLDATAAPVFCAIVEQCLRTHFGIAELNAPSGEVTEKRLRSILETLPA